MSLLQKINVILSFKLPNWLGIVCAVVVISLVLILIISLIFPEQVGNFISDYGFDFLQ
jgi:hypothetical protein